MNADPIITALLDSLTLVLPEALLVLAACVLFLGGTFRAGRDLWGTAALVSLAVGGLALYLSWPGMRAEPVEPARINRLVERLGSAEPAEREEAFGELERFGARALPQLRRTAKQDDPDMQRLVDRVEAPVFGSTLHQDRLTLFVKVVALIAGAVLVLTSWRETPDGQAAECFACQLIIVAGLALVGTANDLVTLFLALELISIPSYVLLYLPRYDNDAQEAAMKYFLLSVFSSALLLFGFSYLYGLTGTTNLPALADALGRAGSLPLLALAALVLVVAGLGFKITAVPFHFYAPDVYQGTPTSNAALLAFLPKAAGFVALLRVLAFVPPEVLTPQGAVVIEPAVRYPGMVLGKDVRVLLWILAAVTMTLGNVLALLQNNFKRMLAYSSVAHAGYMLIGLGVATMVPGRPAGVDVSGVDALLFYLVAYGAMTVGAFGVLLYVSTPERPVETVDDLAGLGQSSPGLALLMALFLFSLIGIPLTAGFWGKLFLFWGALAIPGTADADAEAQARLFRILALIGAINAAVAAWYYLRVVGVMFLRGTLRPLMVRPSLPGLAALAACALMTVGFGVYPRPLLHAVQTATAPSATPTTAATDPGPSVGRR